MKNKKLMGTFLLSLSYVSIIIGVLTAMPWPAMTEVNILGYKSLCSFTPASTAICILLANTFFSIRKKKFL